MFKARPPDRAAVGRSGFDCVARDVVGVPDSARVRRTAGSGRRKEKNDDNDNDPATARRRRARARPWRVGRMEDVPPPPANDAGRPRFGAGASTAGSTAEDWRKSKTSDDGGDWTRRQPSVLATMDAHKRSRAEGEAKALEEKENEFHLRQAKVRADIRIKEGRAKAIDLISRNVFAESYVEFDAFVNPLTVLKGLTAHELGETRKELEELRELDTKNAQRREFWSALIGLTEEEMNEHRKNAEIELARVRGQTSERAEATGLHADIDEDVVEIVGGKSASELAELESEISEQIEGPDASEVEYWGAVLQRVKLAKKRAIVEETHKELKVKFEREEIEDGGRARSLVTAAPAEEDDDDDDLLGDDFGKHTADDDARDGGEWDDTGDEPERTALAEFDPSLSPMRLQEVEDGIEIIDIDQEEANLTRFREEERIKSMSRFKKVTSENRVLRGKTEEDVYNAFKKAGGAHHNTGVLANLITGTTDFKDIEKQADKKAKDLVERMMGATEDGDANFSAEVALESQAYWWHDKYRPRKPKYFNRVHTGYSWNKYNQTHYDSSNPPPKIVQGYKFNIFYPDLIDTTKAPSYKIEPDGSPNAETCLLKITAGPPYEDIAFKIVNKEWEYSHKRGFRCTFERGIFHLYVNFKRSRYRR